MTSPMETKDWVHGRSDFEDGLCGCGMTYDNRHMAAAEAVECMGLVDGDSYQTAWIEEKQEEVPLPLDVDALIESVGEEHYHEWAEGVFEAFDASVTKEMRAQLEVEMRAVWATWLDRHGLRPTLIHTHALEHHIVEEG